MIFAAGLGTRMAPLTDDRPKPLISVAGKPLLFHALEPAFAAGLDPVVVNAHYKANQIQDALKASKAVVTVEEDRLLDTGGGLKAALPLLRGTAVFTMNSDAVWAGPNPYEILSSSWDEDVMDALVLCVPQGRAIGRDDSGDFSIGTDNTVTRGPGHFYTGAQIIKAETVRKHPEEVFSMNAVWDKLIAAKRLYAVTFPGHWCDVGRPESIPMAEALLDV